MNPNENDKQTLLWQARGKRESWPFLNVPFSLMEIYMPMKWSDEMQCRWGGIPQSRPLNKEVSAVSASMAASNSRCPSWEYWCAHEHGLQVWSPWLQLPLENCVHGTMHQDWWGEGDCLYEACQSEPCNCLWCSLKDHIQNFA